ncbi:MAG: hypothetical protein JXR53_08555 [Bacteroidales bacterium]|nr:hypothetical protein [Bacteroidales bacterium]
MNIREKSAQLEKFAAEIKESVQSFHKENPEGIIHNAHIHNKWFSPENIVYALENIAESMSAEKIENWLSKYKFGSGGKNIALILAGNIPAVGFHDVLCTLLSGHNARIKMSSDDKILIPFLCKTLVKYIPEFENRFSFEDEILKEFDAVIATGSNNSERYFKKYFSDKPNIIRHNRNSLAILDGSESEEDLVNLNEDIFRYFGLGCRNVSLLMIPKGYQWKPLLDIINKDRSILFHNAYANNMTYYTAYFSLMDEKLIDGGTVLLRESKSPASPPAVLHFSEYESLEEANKYILSIRDSLQCVVRKNPDVGETAFGMTQKPRIDDYADNVDTMEFLSKV